MNAMKIYKVGSLASDKAPEKAFTGDVYVSDYFGCEPPGRVIGATVMFTPGSRTPWKINPLGQTLIVTSGIGYAQCEGEAIVELHAGDIVWCPPGQRHWDGAAPDHTMTFIAIHEARDGSAVEFGDKVTDEEYQKAFQQ